MRTVSISRIYRPKQAECLKNAHSFQNIYAYYKVLTGTTYDQRLIDTHAVVIYRRIVHNCCENSVTGIVRCRRDVGTSPVIRRRWFTSPPICPTATTTAAVNHTTWRLFGLAIRASSVLLVVPLLPGRDSRTGVVKVAGVLRVAVSVDAAVTSASSIAHHHGQPMQ